MNQFEVKQTNEVDLLCVPVLLTHVECTTFLVNFGTENRVEESNTGLEVAAQLVKNYISKLTSVWLRMLLSIIRDYLEHSIWMHT